MECGFPARARVVAYGMLVAILFAGLAQIEFWPLTAFRLFSSVRGPTQITWELAVVEVGDTHETVVDLSGLPPALKGADHILPRLAASATTTGAAHVADTVRPWLEATGHPWASVSEVRVYSVVVRLGGHGRGPPVPVSRTLRAEVVS